MYWCGGWGIATFGGGWHTLQQSGLVHVWEGTAAGAGAGKVQPLWRTVEGPCIDQGVSHLMALAYPSSPVGVVHEHHGVADDDEHGPLLHLLHPVHTSRLGPTTPLLTSWGREQHGVAGDDEHSLSSTSAVPAAPCQHLPCSTLPFTSWGHEDHRVTNDDLHTSAPTPAALIASCPHVTDLAPTNPPLTSWGRV